MVIENGTKTIYLRLIKALYGCVKSAILWYQLFTECLEGMGFKLNPSNLCVANKMINGKQCTIVWYVDDNKISHVDSAVTTDIIEKIDKTIGKMTVSRGKEHTFLGMDITFKDNGTVAVKMRSYLKDAIAKSKMNI